MSPSSIRPIFATRRAMPIRIAIRPERVRRSSSTVSLSSTVQSTPVLRQGRCCVATWTVRSDSGEGSDLDLPAEFDDPVGRDAKELGGVKGKVRQEDEQPVAPAKHGGTPRSGP